MRSLLPLLIVLACPLMMIVMMRGHGGHGGHGDHSPDDDRVAELEREVARLRDESAARR